MQFELKGSQQECSVQIPQQLRVKAHTMTWNDMQRQDPPFSLIRSKLQLPSFDNAAYCTKHVHQLAASSTFMFILRFSTVKTPTDLLTGSQIPETSLENLTPKMITVSF